MNIKTANRLCELRKKHNLSQEELAAKLGVSSKLYQNGNVANHLQIQII